MHNASTCRPLLVVTFALLFFLLLSTVEGRGGRGGGGRGFGGGRSSSRGWGGGSRSSGGRSFSSSFSSSRSSYRPRSYGSGGGRTYTRMTSWSQPRMTETSVTNGVFMSTYYPRTSFIVFHSRPVHYVHGTVSNSQGQQNETVGEIQDPAAPFRVQNVSYFWGTQFLPNATLNSTDAVSDLLKGKRNECTTYEYSNDGTSNYTVCSVETMDQCARPISDLKDVRFKNLRFLNGNAPTHLAWLCGGNSACCEWDCCEEESNYFAIVLISLVLVLVFYLAFREAILALFSACRQCLYKYTQCCRSSSTSSDRRQTSRSSNTFTLPPTWPLAPHQPPVTRPLLTSSAPPLQQVPPAYEEPLKN